VIKQRRGWTVRQSVEGDDPTAAALCLARIWVTPVQVGHGGTISNKNEGGLNNQRKGVADEEVKECRGGREETVRTKVAVGISEEQAPGGGRGEVKGLGHREFNTTKNMGKKKVYCELQEYRRKELPGGRQGGTLELCA